MNFECRADISCVNSDIGGCINFEMSVHTIADESFAFGGQAPFVGRLQYACFSADGLFALTKCRFSCFFFKVVPFAMIVF